ncbi:conjugal transfer protein TraR [Pseudoalteromonas tunicata]|uniref:Putative DksA-type zinc finger protein n=2 Tax=Pseudoalteromonas tunicata TaxID=314281 RepID=A4C5Q6_9GAMM|nr:conjugal transfer protein TraR [Pseudoalteromonas tunicata]EAR29310.1 putative DksA-type zinc finger protein [Pseudoalteromonas tunicata D2]
MLPMAARLNAFKDRLNHELIELQNLLLKQLTDSDTAIEQQLAVHLKSSSNENWVELLEHKVSPHFNELIAKLNRIEAALCQFDIGQFGYCADCEEIIELARLENDPTEQRCASCAKK